MKYRNKNNKEDDLFVKFFGDEDQYLSRILKEEMDNELVDKIKKYVDEAFGNDVSMSQIRNIYSKLRSVQDVKKLPSLRPKIAYIAGRNIDIKKRSKGKENFVSFLTHLDVLISNITDNDDKALKRLKDFMEAIVAYHRYYHPKS